MPATPRFKVSQTDNAVIVSIKVPHVRVSSAETHVDGREFSFYCKPYLLRYVGWRSMAGLLCVRVRECCSVKSTY